MANGESALRTHSHKFKLLSEQQYDFEPPSLSMYLNGIML